MKDKILSMKSDIASLIVRLTAGAVFIVAGWMKISDMTTTVSMFSSMHIPAFLTYMVGYGEFIGGILLVAGLFVEYSALYLMVIMIVAIYMTRKLGFQSYALPLSVLGSLASIAGLGGGKFSIQKYLFVKKNI